MARSSDCYSKLGNPEVIQSLVLQTLVTIFFFKKKFFFLFFLSIQCSFQRVHPLPVLVLWAPGHRLSPPDNSSGLQAPAFVLPRSGERRAKESNKAVVTVLVLSQRWGTTCPPGTVPLSPRPLPASPSPPPSSSQARLSPARRAGQWQGGQAGQDSARGGTRCPPLVAMGPHQVRRWGHVEIAELQVSPSSPPGPAQSSSSSSGLGLARGLSYRPEGDH